MSKTTPQKILFVAGEARPYAASGGLADVMGALPKSLKAAYPECDIRVCIPFYKTVYEQFRPQLTPVLTQTVIHAWRKTPTKLYSCEQNGVVFYFIDCPQYFMRDALYGYSDDIERFAYFCRAVEQTVINSAFMPDILHLNDWQTAALAAIVRERGIALKTVLTIHNIEYQGQFNIDHLYDLTGIDNRFLGEFEWQMNGNLLKGGIMCADQITTVSPTYAAELTQNNTSSNLCGALLLRKNNFTGILNGIDYDLYNPETCPKIARHYDSKTVKEAKLYNKKIVEAYFSLPSGANELPLVAMVTRLAHHKGIEIVCEMLPHMIEKMRFVLLGNGDPAFERFFRQFAAEHRNAAVHIGFDDTLAKQVYAAADYFLMPSLTEPCGLSQMIACRYGALPVVRGVGGLADSIKHGQNGFVFYDYWSYSMGNSLSDALNIFGTEEYDKMQKAAMECDFSWSAGAAKYMELYRKVIR